MLYIVCISAVQNDQLAYDVEHAYSTATFADRQADSIPDLQRYIPASKQIQRCSTQHRVCRCETNNKTDRQTNRQPDTHSALCTAPPFMHMQNTQKGRRTANQTGRQAKIQAKKTMPHVHGSDRQTDRQASDTSWQIPETRHADILKQKTSTQAKHRQTDTRTDRETDREGKQRPTVTDLQAN